MWDEADCEMDLYKESILMVQYYDDKVQTCNMFIHSELEEGCLVQTKPWNNPAGTRDNLHFKIAPSSHVFGMNQGHFFKIHFNITNVACYQRPCLQGLWCY